LANGWRTEGIIVAIGSDQRRRERRPLIKTVFAESQVDTVLDLLDLTDMAWHDCYGPRELEIPPAVLDDMLLLANGDVEALVRIAREAVIDFRDLRLAADRERERDKRG
jgi:hypothetical protein